jgi:hypothetical protein
MKKVTFESWVSSFVEKLSDYFNLSGWVITVVYSDEDNGGTYATMDTDSTYQFAVLTIYCRARKEFAEGEIDKIVMALVHETVHILLDPFHEHAIPFLSPSSSPVFMKILEQQTQKLAMVFLKSLPPKPDPTEAQKWQAQ